LYRRVTRTVTGVVKEPQPFVAGLDDWILELLDDWFPDS